MGYQLSLSTDCYIIMTFDHTWVISYPLPWISAAYLLQAATIIQAATQLQASTFMQAATLI